MSKSWLIFCSVFSLVGIVCLFIGYRVWDKNRELKANGIQTTATVIGHHEQDRSRGSRKSRNRTSTAKAVIVQYADNEGKNRVFYSTTYTTPVMYDVGEIIKIWYKKDNPDDVLMEGKDEWLLPLILGGLGFIFSLIGIPNLLKELFKST